MHYKVGRTSCQSRAYQEGFSNSKNQGGESTVNHTVEEWDFTEAPPHHAPQGSHLEPQLSSTPS